MVLLYVLDLSCFITFYNMGDQVPDYALVSCIASFEHRRLTTMNVYFNASFPCHMNIAVSPILCSIHHARVQEGEELEEGIYHIILNVRELFMVFSIQCPDFGQDCVFPSERSPSQSRKMQ
jgi:hypothetical protein